MNLPILGICRGAQILNVSRGGNLFQSIQEAAGCARDLHERGHAEAVELCHSVQVVADTLLAHICGRSPHLLVNSRHHQAVRRLGSGLIAAAVHVETRTAEGPLIEAIEATQAGHWAVGLQWHPENLVDLADSSGIAARSIFAAFVRQAGLNSAAHAMASST
jgi:putative glutamine amidotransferase